MMSDSTVSSPASRAATFVDAEQAVLLLVDCQPGLALAADSRPHQEFVGNVTALVRTANVFDVPVIATTSARDRFSGPVLPQIAAELREQPIERRPLDAYQDDAVRAAVTATGRKQLLIAGALTEACVAFPALSFLAAGYSVSVVADCSAGITAETHQLALSRVQAAGAVPVSWIQLLLEWQQDWSHQDTYAAATGILTDFGQGYGLALRHAWDLLSSPAATPSAGPA